MPRHIHLFVLALGVGGALVSGRSATATLPLPVYPHCGENNSLEECPPDLVRSDGSWNGSTWEFVSFIPDAMKRRVRPQELALGAGNGFDVAWRHSTGRFDVTIAVLDSGALWHHSEMERKYFINSGELPVPINAQGQECSAYDCNGDGIFNIDDYADDPRVSADAGDDSADDRLEPSDLIATFQDGIDDDDNGFIDDIAGWDFLWNDNDPYATNGFDHGAGVMRDIAAEGGQPDSKIGYCPNCSILPIRTGDSFMADADRLAQGIMYAVDQGVKVIAMASGTVNNPAGLHDAIRYAWEHGVFVVAAIGDEMSYHHLYPGASDYLMAVHSIRYLPLDDWDTAKTFLAYNGCNNYGSHLTVVAGTTACATGATAITAGAAGLILSYGLDQGVVLHPDEVRGMLINSATDIDVAGSSSGNTPYFPSQPGWDLYFGYGRVNVGKALEDWRIPPQVHLTSPGWFDYIDAATTTTIPIEARIDAPRDLSYTWTLEWAPGGDPSDNPTEDSPSGDFEVLASGYGSEPTEGVIYSWDISDIDIQKFGPAAPVEAITSADPMGDKFDKVNTHTITLRLTAIGSNGIHAEMRKSFFLREDPDLLVGFPLDLGSSGQSSPVLIDFNGDGAQEIALGTAGGDIHIIDVKNGGELPGWPITMPLTSTADPANPDAHANQPAYASGQVAPLRQQVLSTLAVGDLDASGDLEVVAATMDGLLYVFEHDGRLRDGFPVSRDPVSDSDTDEWNWYDPGFISSPALADFDGDGTLEIVQAGMDQKLYVWREDGSRYPGFPVVLEDAQSDVHIKGRIVSSPAIADMNLDGVPDIVVGSNEYDPELYFPGYAYAINGLGYNAPGGDAILPGWPVTVPAAINGLVPFVGEGVTTSPVVADVDGDGYPEVALTGPISCPHLYEHTGERTVLYSCAAEDWDAPATDEALGFAYISNPLFADVDLDGHTDFICALSGLNYLSALGLSTWFNYQDHMIGVWDAATGDSFPRFPLVIEDLPAFMRPEVADVDGDALPEVIVTTGGYIVHAFDLGGNDAPGWPRLTGGFGVSAIEAGDVNGDGRTDVVMATQEGYLFAWGTDGVAASVKAAEVHPPAVKRIARGGAMNTKAPGRFR